MTRKAIAQFTEPRTGGLLWKLSARAAAKKGDDDYTDDPDQLEDPLEERKDDAEEAGETGSDDSANGPEGEADDENGDDDDEEENGDDDNLEIVDMMIYGDIGTGLDFALAEENGVSAAQFRRALASVPNAKRINLHINSAGGNIYDALAIMNVLGAHAAEKVAYVDGLAASAASVLAVAADKTVMRQNSFMYIHNSWAAAIGDKATMTKAAEQLEKADSTIADIYAQKTELPKADILQMMTDTTWMTAREAKARGFADSVRGKSARAKKSSDANAYVFNGLTFNLDPKRFKNIPATLARLKITKPAAQSKHLVSAPAVNTENPMNIEQLRIQSPELYQEVYNLGANSERERIAKLDRLIYPATALLVAEAKAGGKTAGDIMEAVVVALANAKPEPEPKEQPPPLPKISISRARDAAAVNSLGADISADHKVELSVMERRAQAAELIANSVTGRNGALVKKTLK
jgi:ATP-dependent protease ClpP protease subunit